MRLGISACLLGQKVRYDGGHKRDTFLVAVFGRYLGVTIGEKIDSRRNSTV
jgi:uncharacterized protein YbbK (DUF523 family)